jgi:hypothetical protein
VRFRSDPWYRSSSPAHLRTHRTRRIAQHARLAHHFLRRSAPTWKREPWLQKRDAKHHLHLSRWSFLGLQP